MLLRILWLPVLGSWVACVLRVSHMRVHGLMLLLGHRCEDSMVSSIRIRSILVELNLWGGHCGECVQPFSTVLYVS